MLPAETLQMRKSGLGRSLAKPRENKEANLITDKLFTYTHTHYMTDLLCKHVQEIQSSQGCEMRFLG
jgi:hypothetical protein